jgi:hypothetical protein
MDNGGDFTMQLTGNSEPTRSNAAAGQNYFSDYYPGDPWVGHVGLTFFPKNDATKVADMFTELDNVYANFSWKSGGGGVATKPFSITAYTRQISGFASGADCSTPSPTHAYWNAASSGCLRCGVTETVGGVTYNYDSTTNAGRYAQILDWAQDHAVNNGGKFSDLIAFEAVGAKRCEDGRIGAKKESDGTNGYGNHMTESRNRLNTNSKYGFAQDI